MSRKTSNVTNIESQTKGDGIIIGHHNLRFAIVYEGLGYKVINDYMTLEPLLIAYRLATLIESIVDPLGRGPVLNKEPVIDQAPEIEDAADNVRISTLINTGCGRVPFVSRGLERFVEGHVWFQFARRIVCLARVDVVGVAI